MRRGRRIWYWDEYGERRLGWRRGSMGAPAGRSCHTSWAEPCNGGRYYFSSRRRNSPWRRCAETVGAAWSRLSLADRPPGPCRQIISLKNRLFGSVFLRKTLCRIAASYLSAAESALREAAIRGSSDPQLSRCRNSRTSASSRRRDLKESHSMQCTRSVVFFALSLRMMFSR
jgi:hypothetical protein